MNNKHHWKLITKIQISQSFILINFQKNNLSTPLDSLHGQKYMDTWTLHLNVIVEHGVPKPWALICCYNSLQSEGKAFHQMLNLTAGICSHSATRALVRPNTDVGEVWLSVGVSVHAKGVGWGWGQSSSSTSNWEKHFFMELTLRMKPF